MPDILDALCAHLHTDIDRHGRAHADCPFCGALSRNRSGGAAFHFYLYDLPHRRGAVCWSCGWRGSLVALARELDVAGEDSRPVRAEYMRPTPPWERISDSLAVWRRYVLNDARHPQIVSRWQAYKPLTVESITTHALGVSKVPFWDEARHCWKESRYPRLLIPLVVDDRIVGFRGRAYDPHDTGPKWLTASCSETVLVGLEDVRTDQHVIWCENLVDRLLALQVEPSVAVVTSGGLTWRQEWIDELAAKRPRSVVLWFDHDLSGNGSRYHQAEWITAWRTEMEQRRADNPALAARPFPSPPEPRGPIIANALLKAGVRASVYAWPRHTPRGADLGWALMQERETPQ